MKSSSAAYILEQGSTMLKEEREKLKYLKNQQISELKNIIEYEFKKLKRKTRKSVVCKKRRKSKPV